ncbi:Gcd10p family [Babesia microti strain RI]|uniref:tRNA (adenine(58)-N(1))-methyltransferase non-catalytic subunit TRM6 n=1 Tax=Babesia microti (strain RI) TaxID=1133968 RepID=A0A1R4AC54_BABMR|nr:Gcd10p family [Babesia microti strain RI]SJK86601.1 Gcd10p family [Babesia microti strain RI]|eukprot:XP_021338740.1 Gcd10p family [Babesia microti strain RI]
MIKEGDNIIIYDFRCGKRIVKVVPDRSLYINKQLLELKLLIGTELGCSYEWDGENWQVVDRIEEDEFEFVFDEYSSSEDVLNYYNSEFVGDNRNIYDDNASQQLTSAEIDIWRNVTNGGMKLVKHIADNSKSLGNKPIFSREKYINKKKRKYINAFKTMRATLYDVCDSYWMRYPSKIGFVRPDYLANILYSANLTSNSQVMVFDHSMGLILAGVAQRLFHNSSICESNGLIYPLVAKGVSDKILHECNFIQPTFYPIDLKELINSLNNINIDIEKRPRSYHDENVSRINPKRNLLYPTLAVPANMYIDNIIATISYIKDADVDVLVEQIVAVSDKLLIPSGTIVIFCQHIQPLIVQQARMTSSGNYVQVRLEELFHREYQILPRRTHPFMKLDRLCTGFILSAIKISSDVV